MGFPQAWRAANPGHRYERLTDANAETWARAWRESGLGEEEDDDVADLFAGLHDPILRADLLRYMVMAREGGVWADVDVYPHRSIASWIPAGFRERSEEEDEQQRQQQQLKKGDGEGGEKGPGNATAVVNLVVGIENDHHGRPIWPGSPYSVQLAQYVMLAKPGHPALLAALNRACANLRALLEAKKVQGRPQTQAKAQAQTQNAAAAAAAELEGLGFDRRRRRGGSAGMMITFEDVMKTTGPFVFTRALMEYFGQVTGTVHTGDELRGLREPVLIGDVLVLPRDSFGWLPDKHTHPKGHHSILVEHLFMGSWRDTHPG